jgi:hypothetical protein
MQFWQCPLLLMVSLIAAINTQQTPSQRLEPNQVAGLVELHQQLEQSREHQQLQQPEQPAQADNKVRSRHYLSTAVYISFVYIKMSTASYPLFWAGISVYCSTESM